MPTTPASISSSIRLSAPSNRCATKAKPTAAFMKETRSLKERKFNTGGYLQRYIGSFCQINSYSFLLFQGHLPLKDYIKNITKAPFKARFQGSRGNGRSLKRHKESQPQKFCPLYCQKRGSSQCASLYLFLLPAFCMTTKSILLCQDKGI